MLNASILNGVAFLGILFTYFPQRAVTNVKKMDIVKKIDYIGAVLSITGLTLLYVAYVL
jgi:hypothetical protein